MNHMKVYAEFNFEQKKRQIKLFPTAFCFPEGLINAHFYEKLKFQRKKELPGWEKNAFFDGFRNLRILHYIVLDQQICL